MIDTDPLTRCAESFGYAREIQQPWGGLQNVLDWCKTEITDGTWRWQLIEISNGVDPGQYMWPAALKPDRRLKIGVELVEKEGALIMNVRRNAPKQQLAPHPHLVNDGKANISSNVPAEFNPRLAQHFAHLKPRWA